MAHENYVVLQFNFRVECLLLFTHSPCILYTCIRPSVFRFRFRYRWEIFDIGSVRSFLFFFLFLLLYHSRVLSLLSLSSRASPFNIQHTYTHLIFIIRMQSMYFDVGIGIGIGVGVGVGVFARFVPFKSYQRNTHRHTQKHTHTTYLTTAYISELSNIWPAIFN